MRKSFTLIELIFVLVILGIVGSFTSQIIMNLYTNYILQKASLRLETMAQNTLNILGNQLQNSIKDSVALVGTGANDYKSIDTIETQADGDFTKTSAVKGVVWIAKDRESLQGMSTLDIDNKTIPAYNGIADFSESGGEIMISGVPHTKVVSKCPEYDTVHKNNSAEVVCDFTSIKEIVQNITGSDKDSGLYFTYGNLEGNVYDRFWQKPLGTHRSIFGLDPAYNFTERETLVLDQKPNQIGDIFDLVHSAYGLIWTANPQIGTHLQTGSLSLITGINTWRKTNPTNFEDQLKDTNAKHLLLEDVTKFYMWTESGGSIVRMYLCLGDLDVEDALGIDNYEICKESVVLR